SWSGRRGSVKTRSPAGQRPGTGEGSRLSAPQREFVLTGPPTIHGRHLLRQRPKGETMTHHRLQNSGNLGLKRAARRQIKHLQEKETLWPWFRMLLPSSRGSKVSL